MENLEPYLDKFDESGRRILESALNETRRRKQNFISPEHILYALIIEETDLFNETMHNISIDSQAIRLAVEKRIENSRRYTGKGLRIAPETTEIFKYSMDKARSENRRTIQASDICSILAANKYSLLDDVLQNPEGSIPIFKPSRIEIEEDQSHFFSKLKIKPTRFLNEFSLKESVKNNPSRFGLLCANHTGGGHGTCVGGGNSEQTTYNKHESSVYWIKAEDFDESDKEEFIALLKKDVEDSINQSGLNITETNSPNSSSFHFEYEVEGMKGEINISGEMKNKYYELKAMVVEKSIEKQNDIIFTNDC